MLAHELRNPLGPIRNAAHYMRLKEVSPDFCPPLEMIERQVRHMVRLIDDLLDVSRISRGALELRLEEIRFAEVVDAAVDACRVEIQEHRHTLRVNLPKHAVLLRGDRARLIQILCNLLTNAAKFTPPGGVIELNATTRGGTLVLRVIDNGMGIAPGKLNAIFDLFTQVDRSLERQGGLGIGLTLVRQLIELHGGSIEAKSDGVGRGSEFILTLPIRAGDEASAEVSAGPARVSPGRPRRILVADDSHDAAKSLTLLLRQCGHEVYTAFDGMEAVLSAQECRPEVMIVDIGMPKMNGYEVARRIRELPWAKGVCLVALTGWGQEADRHRARESGFDTHLVKPVDPDAINALLSKL
ncbi:MAG TPA: ATP-binding protein [Candidatus Polarisedimenticolia bacterium]|nr:ATP-binding protein [Candidatus Polarisedimenticolia bacterium]